MNFSVHVQLIRVGVIKTKLILTILQVYDICVSTCSKEFNYFIYYNK